MAVWRVRLADDDQLKCRRDTQSEADDHYVDDIVALSLSLSLSMSVSIYVYISTYISIS